MKIKHYVSELFIFVCKCIFFYAFSGGLWLLIEIAYRGYTDLSMYFLVGFIGVFATLFNNIFTYETDYLIQILVITAIATLGEGITGNIINLDYTIWDYRGLPLSLWNDQINLLFIGIWAIIIAIMIPMLDYIEWKLFDFMPDTPPYYKVLGKKIFEFKAD